ncbi:DUF6191 domain-containing protein [Nocardia sp. CS682]|uniref:DUF6191 domain-containing protein n=1 Tax=Nocardia sp. CS682 TaxID=1047172 RepID=UPI00351A1D9E
MLPILMFLSLIGLERTVRRRMGHHVLPAFSYPAYTPVRAKYPLRVNYCSPAGSWACRRRSGSCGRWRCYPTARVEPAHRESVSMLRDEDAGGAPPSGAELDRRTAILRAEGRMSLAHLAFR